MNTKAQINQIFTILFALLIIGLIVVFASKGISGILKDKCNADLLKFKVDIKNSVVQYKDYGSVEKHMLLAPCDYFQMCVIDSKATNIDPTEASDELNKFLELSVTDEGVLRNVFLFDGNVVTDAGFIPELRVDDPSGYLCVFKKASRFTFITQGKGQFAEIMDVAAVPES